MRSTRWSISRRLTLAAAAAGGAAGLFLAVPSRGQQNQPVIHFTLPATVARGSSARVTYDLTLPAGVQLPRNPRVRVVDDKDMLWELLPLFITQRAPVWTGYRDLHSENYLPGTYRVSVEVDYQAPGGRVPTKWVMATAAAPVATLTIPGS